MTVVPYQIEIPQATIDDLRARLAATRWPDAVDGASWDYGTDLDYMKSLVAYWHTGYDWYAIQNRLNAFNHVSVEIDGLNIHAVHQRGTGPNPTPLLILHGWPSSFVQMLPLIPLLTDPAAHGGDPADSFDVVVASLPGFGFSDRPTEPGMHIGAMAPLMIRLMKELGYDRFGMRASDLGAGVAMAIALSRPDAVIGFHTGGSNPWVPEVPVDLSEAEQAFVANAAEWSQQEGAYAMLQATKPQTLSFGLNDSPAGLAAWILEKFRTWGDTGGDLESTFDRDDLLTNVTIYWVTETISSSVRLYYELMRSMTGGSAAWGRPDVPTAMLMSSKDMIPTPREWVERTYRIDRWIEIDRGGHFLEQEEPHLVATDLRAFFHDLH